MGTEREQQEKSRSREPWPEQMVMKTVDARNDATAPLGACPRELFRRFVQCLFSSFIFDGPGFSFLKISIYRCFFKIGRNSYISRASMLLSAHSTARSSLKIGENVGIEHYCDIDYSGGLEIRDNVWISRGVLIETHDHRIKSRDLKKNQPVEFTPLVIEEDAWIGAGAIILATVKRIGTGAVIGAGSVVTKDVEDWSIVAGNPARIINSRSENLTESPMIAERTSRG